MAESLPHLQRHHGDFHSFRDTMVETSQGRFGPIWWGVWETYASPAPGATVVDLGTGPGLLLPMLRERVPDGRLIGVEVQPVMLETAREQAASCGAEIVEADLAAPVPLEDGVADVVTAVMVFHEMELPPPLLDEIFRLLKPGGTLLLYDWVRQDLEDYLRDRELDLGLMQHFREHCIFTPDDLAFLIRRAGFDVHEVIGRRGNRYAIVAAEKPV